MHLRGSDLDEEAAAFVGHLQDLGPREAVDPQLVFVHHQPTGADPQRDVHPIQVLQGERGREREREGEREREVKLQLV